MSIIIDRKQSQFSKEYGASRRVRVWTYTLKSNEVANLYAEVVVHSEDKRRIAKFVVEGIFLNRGSGVASDGVSIREVSNPDGFDNRLLVYGSGNEIQIWIWPKTARTRTHWQGEISLEIRRDEPSPNTGNPRMQLTIVGMEAAKKSGFLGLSDGVNYILSPGTYSAVDSSGPSPIVKQEVWVFDTSKALGTTSFSELLRFAASVYGSGTSITSITSNAILKWYTGTGDFGEGSVVTRQFVFTTTAGVTGYLKNRAMFGSYKSPEGVSFIWGKYDPTGWANYA